MRCQNDDDRALIELQGCDEQTSGCSTLLAIQTINKRANIQAQRVVPGLIVCAPVCTYLHQLEVRGDGDCGAHVMSILAHAHGRLKFPIDIRHDILDSIARAASTRDSVLSSFSQLYANMIAREDAFRIRHLTIYELGMLAYHRQDHYGNIDLMILPSPYRYGVVVSSRPDSTHWAFLLMKGDDGKHGGNHFNLLVYKSARGPHSMIRCTFPKACSFTKYLVNAFLSKIENDIQDVVDPIDSFLTGGQTAEDAILNMFIN